MARPASFSGRNLMNTAPATETFLMAVLFAITEMPDQVWESIFSTRPAILRYVTAGLRTAQEGFSIPEFASGRMQSALTLKTIYSRGLKFKLKT